jgi:hypothetical protein
MMFPDRLLHNRSKIKTKVVGAGVTATAGDIIAGGIIGLGVDAAIGAGLDHVPNPVSVSLQPEVPPAPPPCNSLRRKESDTRLLRKHRQSNKSAPAAARVRAATDKHSGPGAVGIGYPSRSDALLPVSRLHAPLKLLDATRKIEQTAHQQILKGPSFSALDAY